MPVQKNVKVSGISMPPWVRDAIIAIQNQEATKNRSYMSLNGAMVYLIIQGIEKYSKSLKEAKMEALNDNS